MSTEMFHRVRPAQRSRKRNGLHTPSLDEHYSRMPGQSGKPTEAARAADGISPRKRHGRRVCQYLLPRLVRVRPRAGTDPRLIFVGLDRTKADFARVRET